MGSPSGTRKGALPLLLPLVCGLLFVIGFEMGGFQFVLRGVSTEFAMTATGAGVLVAVQNIGEVLMPVLFGSLSDRVGKKRILLAAAAVFIAGCAVAASAESARSFILGVFLIGAGYSVCETTGSAALADAYPEKSAKYMNLSQCLLSVGAVASPILVQGGMRAFAWSWRAVFVLCAAAYAALLCLLLFTRVTPSPEAPSVRARGSSFLPILRSRLFRLLFLSILLYVGLEVGIGYFTESLFAITLSQASLGAYAISAYWAAMALARLMYSLLPTRAYVTLFSSLWGSAILFLLLAVSRTAVISLLLCGLIGFSFGPVWSLLIDLAAKLFPSHSGAAIGLMSAAGGIGGIAFPTLVGFISDNASLPAAFLALSITSLLAGVFCFTASRSVKRPQ